MKEEGPPLGLSEDEAYRPPAWVRPVLALCLLAFILMVALQALLGTALLLEDGSTLKAWDFWGNTSVLAGMFLASAALMALGTVLLLGHDDDGLSMLLLGLVVLAVAMLWGIVVFEGAGGPAALLLLMLVPLLALFGLQTSDVRRWWFQDTDADE